MSLMQIQQIITQKLGKKKLHSCSHLVTANSQKDKIVVHSY